MSAVQQVIDGLASQYGTDLKVSECGGSIGIADLKRSGLTNRRPTLLVSSLGFGGLHQSINARFMVEQIIVYIAVAGTPAVANKQCRALSVDVCRYFALNSRAFSCEPLDKLNLRNLFNGQIEQNNIALWSLTFNVSIALESQQTTAFDFSVFHQSTYPIEDINDA